MIGIIGAMACEVALLKNNLIDNQEKTIGGITFNVGKLQGRDVVLAESGIGKVNSSICATIMNTEFNVTKIINTGIAGGLKNLTHKDIVVVNKFTYLDADVTFLGYKIGQIPSMPQYFLSDEKLLSNVKSILESNNKDYKEGVVLTSDKFVTSKENLCYEEDHSVILCEMEGASIAQVCHRFDTPFIGLRFISDMIGEASQIANYMEFEEEMANMSSKITLDLVETL